MKKETGMTRGEVMPVFVPFAVEKSFVPFVLTE